MRIILTGPKCSGKSTIGKQLADTLNLPFYETDELIEKLYFDETGNNFTCREICSDIGDDNFRCYEKRAIEQISEIDWAVISTGGSTMLNSNSRQVLRQNSTLVLFEPSTNCLLKRLKEKKIPAFLNNKTAQEIFITRAKLVIEVIKPFADITIDSSQLTKKETVDYLIEQISIEFNIRNQNPNSFGKLIKLTTFGESHGKALGAILDGVKPGIEISEDIIQQELNRRKPGQSAVSTPRNEADKLQLLSGVFEGKTTGASIGMIINNKDQDSSKYDNLRELFRPGTADYTFWHKYSIRDHRGAGRASGRETASRVMGGAVAKQVLAEYGIKIIAHTTSIAGINAETCNYSEIENNIIRSADPIAAKKMEKLILNAKDNHDSVGGIVQIDIFGIPAGLGDPVFGKIDARLGMAILSIGAVKGIEFGNGFASAKLKGSENNDLMRDGKFLTNNAGGILGGISNGETITIKAAVKPTPSIFKKQQTCNKKSDNINVIIEGRHDPCIVPRIVPVMESMAALTILDMLELQQSINPDFANKFNH